MQFFNQKEEVIDIQLTQFGKRLLSQGRFKPTYYAFYDNDILYDLNYANASGSYKETQSQTEKRILKETPRLKTQYMFESSMRPSAMQWVDKAKESQYAYEQTFDSAESLLEAMGFKDFGHGYLQSALDEAEKYRGDSGQYHLTFNYGTAGTNPYGYIATGGELQLTFDRNYSLGMPIGTMKMGSEYAPAWEIDFLYGKMNNYETHHTGSGASIQIPQLNAEIDYEAYTVNLNPSTGMPERSYIPHKLIDIAESVTGYESADDATIEEALLQNQSSTNNTDLEIVPDFLLLELEEKNTDFLTDNFELEVFEIVETETDPHTGATITQEMPLEFRTSGPIGPQHVEYWFDLSVDEDIESMYFCASDIVVERRKNRLADALMPYPDDCPDFEKTKNLYQEEVFDQEEPC